jgi:hypothetical protein
MSRARSVLLAAAGLSARLTPRERAEWAAAARAEAAAISDTRELARWTLGFARFACGARVRASVPSPAAAAAMGAAAVALAWLDLHTDATGASLLALLVASAGVGALAPRTAVAGGLVIGSAVAAAHATLVLAGAGVPEGHPATLAGAAALLVLVVPALAASLAAARLRRRRA